MKLDHILELVATCPLVDVAEGDTLLSEGVPSEAIFVLIEGALMVQRRGHDVVRISEPGAVLGEIGLLLDQPANADVVAVDGPARLHRVDGEALIREHPEFLGFLAQMLARRLHQISTYLSDVQAQFSGTSTTLGLVPKVLQELLNPTSTEIEAGSEREPDSPY